MVNMLRRCSTGPLRMEKLPMKVIDPQVKLRANFRGFRAKTGMPTKTASAKKSAEKNNSAQKTWMTGKKNFENGTIVWAKDRKSGQEHSQTTAFLEALRDLPWIVVGIPFLEFSWAFVLPWFPSCFRRKSREDFRNWRVAELARSRWRTSWSWKSPHFQRPFARRTSYQRKSSAWFCGCGDRLLLWKCQRSNGSPANSIVAIQVLRIGLSLSTIQFENGGSSIVWKLLALWVF